MPALPIESAIKSLQSSLQSFSQVVLQAPPGAGKSTYLPLTMIKDKWFTGKILMLEPRRLAAKNIACYLSALLNEPVGGKVGYRMRGESKISKGTQLEIVTEGVLTRILQQDPELTGIDLIIFDEFHVLLSAAFLHYCCQNSLYKILICLSFFVYIFLHVHEHNNRCN